MADNPDFPPAVCIPKKLPKSLTIGQIKPTPKTPMITEGIPAKTVTTAFNNSPIGFGAILVIHNAVKTLRGIEITIDKRVK